MELTFKLTMRSDYHIGAGHGLGSQTDSALLRDADNLPALRGSTIEGLLRDGLWRLLQHKPMQKHYERHQTEEERRGKTGDEIVAYCAEAEDCPLCAIFGTPATSKRWQFSSARPADNPVPLDPAMNWQAGQTGAQIAARVRINPRQRRADAGKLFKQEEGDRRLSFIFTVSCPASQVAEQQQAAHDQAALLVAAARMVRRLGSARRRGRGECLIELTHINDWSAAPPADGNWQAHLLSLFRQKWFEDKPVSVSLAPAAWTKSAATTSQPSRFRLIVRADEPIVVARRAEAGNIYDGAEFISGATLLGALAAEAAARRNLSQPEIYDDFLDVFKRGQVRFAPLYPAYLDRYSGDLYPAIPAPLDLLVCKLRRDLSQHKQHNNLASQARVDHVPEDCPACLAMSGDRCHIPLVPLKQFVTVQQSVRSLLPRQREEMHPRINPRTQRVATGNLFGYVALDSGQYFIGELWCQDDRAWQTLSALTDVVREREIFPIRLGKAATRGYGLVKAWLEPAKRMDGTLIDQWRGKPLNQRVTDEKAKQPITMTLLTDAIVTDVWGRCRQRFDLAFLRELIGPEVVKVRNAFCQSGFVDNFNNHLGLPRWRDIALKAGSAIGLEADPSTDPAVLRDRLGKIEEKGIGLRRHEGFGEVVFNHPIYEDGAGVSDTHFRASKLLPLAGKTAGEAKTIWEESFELQNWMEALRDADRFDVKLFRSQQWDAIARWLHTVAQRPVPELMDELAHFGESAWLTDVKREPKDFRAKAETGRAFNQLERLLNGMAGDPEGLRQKKIQSLADNLAAAVEKEKGGQK